MEAFQNFYATVAGLPINHVWRGYGSAIFFEIGKLSPRYRSDGSAAHPEGEVSLGVEWSWRIENQSAIICGSWSEDDHWESSLDLFRNAHIAYCGLFGALPEVVIETQAGNRFLSFSTTDGQPQWHFVDRRSGSPRWYTVRNGKLHLGDGTEPAS